MAESSDVSIQTQNFIHCVVNIYTAAFPAGHILKPTFTIKCGNVWMNHIFLNNTCTSLKKQQFDINPNCSLPRDLHTIGRLAYKYTFCQNGMSTHKKKIASYIFIKTQLTGVFVY
jgi:hypothetical protein